VPGNPGACSPSIVNCGQIASMQGFFVHATPSGTVVNFTESMKTVTSANLFRTSGFSNRLSIELNSEKASVGLNDQAVVIFEDDASLNYESGKDALKLLNPSGINIFTNSAEGYSLVFNKLKMLDTNSIAIPLVINSNDSVKSIKFSGLGTFDQEASLKLYDKKYNSYTEINEGTTYSVTTSKKDTSSTSASRFSILAKSARVSSPEQVTATQDISNVTATSIKLYPNPNESGVLFVESSQTSILTIYSIEGSEVFKQEISAGKNELKVNLNSGLYYVKVGVSAIKLVVK
jgi:hypothetical protein